MVSRMYPYPTVPIAEQARSTRLVGLWSGAVGTALLLFLAVPVLTTIGFARWGEEISGSSDASMFHGGELVAAWLVTNVLALLGIGVLGVVALVLDIVMLVKLHGLRTAGVATTITRPLLIALLAGTALITTPAGLVLMLLPSIVLGPGTGTDTVLVVLAILMFLVPLGGRVAEGVLAARLPAQLAMSRTAAPLRP